MIRPITTERPSFRDLVDQIAYSCINLANLEAKVSKKAIENLFFLSLISLSNNLEAIVGISVTEIKTEIKTDTEMAIPISRNNCPIGNCISKIGIKTTTVVRAEPRIGAHTCLAP